MDPATCKENLFIIKIAKLNLTMFFAICFEKVNNFHDFRQLYLILEPSKTRSALKRKNLLQQKQILLTVGPIMEVNLGCV